MQQGRPRIFDTDIALEKAKDTFCQFGYEGASLSLLTKAMGINSPSLYSAFGDKEHLFIAVLTHYFEPHYASTRALLFTPEFSTFKAFETYATQLIGAHIQCDSKYGCLIANSSIYVGNHYPAIEAKLKDIQTSQETLFYERLQTGHTIQKDIPKTTDCRQVARFLNTLFQGISLQARGQKDPEILQDIGQQTVAYLRGVLEKSKFE